MMYRLDRPNKRLLRLETTSLAEQRLKERSDLQEWIANDPGVLGEDLLIIQKEFAGFDSTNERLDLLALDRDANLVVIENKLDDSGRDVTWQALKYASYCSRLSRENVREMYQDHLQHQGAPDSATELLANFLDVENIDQVEFNKGVSQRIILVARSFRREVTSTVMWLLNYGVRLQCIKVTPYLVDEELILGFEQIIPVRDTEEFMIGLAEKNREELSDRVRESRGLELAFRFWQHALPELQRVNLYVNTNPQRSMAITMPSGFGGLTFNLVIGLTASRSEVYISRSSKQENKAIFEYLYAKRAEIERAFGGQLTWSRLDDRTASRIRHDIDRGLDDESAWNEIIAFFVDSMSRLHSAISPYVESSAEQVRNMAPIDDLQSE